MSSRNHPQARTIAKIRQEIKDCGRSDQEAAKVFNITRATAAKLLTRDDVQGRSQGDLTLHTNLNASTMNGMVERLNGRINELLQQTRFDSRTDLEATMLNYLKLYNHHIPQRASGAKTPVQPLKEWHQKKSDLFVKRVYDQPGLDIYLVACNIGDIHGNP